MKKKICVLTGTRAEYGQLKPLILKLKKEPLFDVRVVVTGSHLSSEFGFTYKEIELDNILIDKKIDMLLSGDSASAVSKSMGLAMIGFADYFETVKPDLLILLGDRYETIAVALTAMNERIPVAHLHGGELTEGAIDDCIRHAITKLSYLHFTSNEVYKNRVIQLGESPERVYCVGATGIENIMNETLLAKIELEKSLNFSLEKPYAVITFHPTTLENSTAKHQIKELLAAIESYQYMKFIFTKANADAEGRLINEVIDNYVDTHENAISVTSLGMRRYLSALKYSTMVIGNSSSGLVEAPTFGIPTVNIGARQKGRLQASSVINCEPNAISIKQAIDKALTAEFRRVAKEAINPYGDGNTSEKIVEVIKEYVLGEKINLKKKFYDCEVN